MKSRGANEEQRVVLLLGGTGRTGRLVLSQLLERGVNVRAVVRSIDRLPAGVSADPGLTVVEADLATLSDEYLRGLVQGCDAVISCLGHNTTLKGVFGLPRDLVTQSATRVCRAIETLQPAKPVKFILMSSVSVNQPAGRAARRGGLGWGYVALIRGLVPPAKDNQRAADFLCRGIGTANPFVEWVAVRPDTLLEGQVTDYSLHDSLVSSLFRPDSTNRANVAHFMCELAQNPQAWDAWRFRLPVVINAASK
jgi:NAD(P)-dependent dehydrogenase (short-subunit alcohol dehydrogenase family)